MAADYAINLELIASGLTLPEGCLLDQKYKGLASEVIYSQLKQQMKPQPKQGQGQGNQTGQGQPTGTFSDAPQGEQDEGQGQGQGKPSPKGQQTQGEQPSVMTEQDWKIAAEQAAKVAKAAGKMPASMERLLGQSRQSKTDWRAELREFLQQTIPSDYSWQHPNRRFVHQGIYLPGTVKENFGTLAIAVDTSGSIYGETLNAFAAEVSAIASELKPEKVTVIFADAQIQNVQEFDEGEEIKLEPKGGGGTLFNPVFDAIKAWDSPPVALLYFTDLECFDAPEEQDYPTLWVTDMSVTREAPFGRAIRIEV
jgi:predicted metal-dependent peptidase